MLFKLAVISAIASQSLVEGHRHAAPSSLIQIAGTSQSNSANADSVLASIQQQVKDFQKQMNQEIADDKEQVRKLKDQQRKMEREEKAFKSKIFAKRVSHSGPASSFAQTNNHFGDPYIDEAMRTIGDDIEAQKREMERLLANQRPAQEYSSFVEKTKRPDLGIIAAALRTRMNMVNH